ncbi:filamentous hemagglutinin N-terminal domain-containing protein [Scytonema sp. PCC 10023]|uniref:filamentous hemagglutinin N-terminal domain-containing protein n=1 Tax=Scytonema sp. PCC 10023 TaxID=1680591 RepID=UPI0039C65CED
MSGITTRWGWFLGIAIGGTLSLSGNCANAQITPDSTLPNNSNVTQVGNTSVINGGTQAGSNLFHSFGKFSIPTGGTAFFNNATDIGNIFSRVTGGSVSNIDGLIKANGTANLFLINPNGIIFGRNASLNIGGSFLASTASSLKFADGFEFSATAPQTTPLLTVSVPIGLQYGGNPGRILNQSEANPDNATNSFRPPVGLQVQPGRTLALVGGDVSLDGGALTAPGGRVELGGVAGTGTIGLNVDSNNVFLGFPNDPAQVNIYSQKLSLSFPNNLAKADISAYKASIEANSIQLQGKQITLTGGSNIRATDSSYLWQPSITYVTSLEGGNIIINAEKLTVRDGSSVNAISWDSSVSGGKLTVTASDSVELSGTLNNQQSELRVANLPGNSSDNNEQLTISTKKLIIRDGAQVSYFSARNRAQGEGNLTINASDSIELTGISTERYQYIPFNDVSEDGRFISGIFSTVFNVGGIGSITVNTKELLIQDGARISASTFSIGKGGTLNINASDSIQLNGRSADGQVNSGLFATSTLSTAGSINIKTGQLNVQNGAEVTVSSKTGSAGNIEAVARSIQLDNQGKLTANSVTGAEGNIFLRVQDLLLLRRNSEISAVSGTPQAGGKGGNFQMDAKFILASENSDIVTNAFTGSGGNIAIRSQSIFGTQFRQQQTQESDIVATGQVTLNTPDVDPSRGLVELPINLVDISQQIDTSCNPNSSQTASSFFITGRGGLSRNPFEMLTSDAVLVDWVTLNPNTDNHNSPSVSTNLTNPTPERIVEATGWVINSKGEVILTANPPTTSSHGSWQNPVSCRSF